MWKIFVMAQEIKMHFKKRRKQCVKHFLSSLVQKHINREHSGMIQICAWQPISGGGSVPITFKERENGDTVYLGGDRERPDVLVPATNHVMLQHNPLNFAWDLVHSIANAFKAFYCISRTVLCTLVCLYQVWGRRKKDISHSWTMRKCVLSGGKNPRTQLFMEEDLFPMQKFPW